jgi:lipopolysaccharide/colanic/teichoic acid biosynthesis glycosyltransferase
MRYKLTPVVPLSKRVFDIFLTILIVPLVLPLFIFLALLVLIFLGKPIFFRQKRPGFQEKIFTMYKFRTMLESKDIEGIILPDGERLTKFGLFLRKTSLDEIPELINILKGEMSWVGPRPLLIEYLPLYSEEQRRRHAVLPGITGWAQINGRNDLSWQEKFTLDVWYVDHWSCLLDIKIILSTIWKVLKQEGINQPGQVTSELFKGN